MTFAEACQKLKADTFFTWQRLPAQKDYMNDDTVRAVTPVFGPPAPPWHRSHLLDIIPCYCPITALYALETGNHLYPSQAQKAGRALNMHAKDRIIMVALADNALRDENVAAREEFSEQWALLQDALGL